VDTAVLTHSIDAPYVELLAKGPHVVEATLGSPLRAVKPYKPEMRAEIDNELADKGIDFMRRQHAAGNPLSAVFDGPRAESPFCAIQG